MEYQRRKSLAFFDYRLIKSAMNSIQELIDVQDSIEGSRHIHYQRDERNERLKKSRI
jgi:hypothetical protein